MAGHSSAAVARAGPTIRSPFCVAVAAFRPSAGWCSAAMIVIAVAITCQMIFVRFVLNQSTVWQTEAVIYLMVPRPCRPALRPEAARPCECGPAAAVMLPPRAAQDSGHDYPLTSS
jgi:hypothetical protein